MEQIKVQFTSPVDGSTQFDYLKFDISKFRGDSSVQPHEDFFFSCNATTIAGVQTQREIPNVAEAAIAANPFNPFGISSVAFGLVGAKAVSGASAVVMHDDAGRLGFTSGDMVAIMADSKTVLAKNIVSSVSGSTLNLTNALGTDVSKNAVVVKLEVPVLYVNGFAAQNDAWGAKAVLEAPGKPTVATGNISVDPYGVAAVDVTITAPTRGSYVVKEYNVFVIDSAEVFDPKMPVIEFNRAADGVATAAGAVVVSTFGGGVDAGGGDIQHNGTYYVVAIAKDSTGKINANCSGLSNIVTVTA